MRRLLWVISLAFVTAACADRVTGPAPTSEGPVLDEIPAGCVKDGVCTLEPITIIGDPGNGGGAGGGGGGGGDGGDAGDPGGGACPTSYNGDKATVQGCTGGSDPEPEPPPSEPSLAGDMARDTIPPKDCSAPDLSQWEELYCFRRMAPDSAQRRATLQALDQIAQRGHVCALIAETGRELLASGRITFFVWQHGDAAGYGHRNTDIQLNTESARLYGTPGSGFERILVHEIDHVRGFDHIDAAGNETPNTAECGER